MDQHTKLIAHQDELLADPGAQREGWLKSGTIELLPDYPDSSESKAS